MTEVGERIIKFLNISQFNKEINTASVECSYSLQIKNPQHDTNIAQIVLSPLYKKCIHLRLKISGMVYDQKDFDNFIEQISQFKELQSFKLRFYNRKVQYLDSLLQNVSNIPELTLDLKHFKKIHLQDEYQLQSYATKRMTIKLKNAFPETNSISKFTDYLGRLSNLETLNLKQYGQKEKIYQLLHKLNPKTKVNLECQIPFTNILDCELLIQDKLINKYNLKASNVNSLMLREYLREKDLLDEEKYNEPFFQNYNNEGFSLNELTLYDFQIAEKVDSFINHIKQLSITSKAIIFYVLEYNNFAKYLLHLIDHLFDEIIIYPNQYVDKDSFSLKKYKKNNWVINISHQYEQFKQIKNVVNVRINIKQTVISPIIFEKVTKFILSQPYLITTVICKNTIPLHNWQENQGIKTVQQKSQTFLRFFVFQKHLKDLIPLPQQIFYDFYDN